MWVVSLPIQLSHRAEGSIGVLAVIGVVLWAVGLYFEVVGDIQLSRLRQTQRIKEKCLTQVCGDTRDIPTTLEMKVCGGGDRRMLGQCWRVGAHWCRCNEYLVAESVGRCPS